MSMTIYSSDYSVLVNKINSCTYDLTINPDFTTVGGGSGLSNVNVGNTSTISLSGNGGTIPVTGVVVVSAEAGNILEARATGLYIAAPTAYTNADARAAISATTPLSYNSTTGVMSIATAGSSSNGALTSTDWSTFNGKVTTGSSLGTGTAVFKQKNGTTLEFKSLLAGTNLSISSDATSITIDSTATVYTDADARAALSGNSPISYNNSNGVISIARSNTTTDGYLAGTDFVTFNDKVSTASNLSVLGNPVFKQKTGTNLEFRTLINGPGMVIEFDATTMTFQVLGRLSDIISTSTNNVPSNIATLSIENNSVGVIEIFCADIQQTTGATALVGSKFVKYHKLAGTLSILGITDDLIPQSMVSGVDIDWDVVISANDLAIETTGETGKTIKWLFRPVMKHYNTA
jgi:hypothetical protein